MYIHTHWASFETHHITRQRSGALQSLIGRLVFLAAGKHLVGAASQWI